VALTPLTAPSSAGGSRLAGRRTAIRIALDRVKRHEEE
jgi:hypothetical protein